MIVPPPVAETYINNNRRIPPVIVRIVSPVVRTPEVRIIVIIASGVVNRVIIGVSVTVPASAINAYSPCVWLVTVPVCISIYRGIILKRTVRTVKPVYP